ncbi:hypothetical protein Aduo_004516 [Ancylostoma duodenale]
MKEIVDLCHTYCQQLENRYDDIIRRSRESFTECSTQPMKTAKGPTSTTSITNDILTAVQEKGEVDTPNDVMVEVFAWASVTTAASMVGTFLGYTVFAPLMRYLVDNICAAIISYLILPLSAHLIFRRLDADPRYADRENDWRLRSLSLIFCTIQGIFNAHVIHNIYVTGQPIPLVTPAAIAYTFANMPKEAGRNRIAQLCSSLNCALTANISIGAITGHLSPPYYFLTLGYCMAAGIVMQIIFKKVHKKTPLHTFQHAVTSLMIAVKGLFFLLFGSYAYRYDYGV